MTTEHDDEKLRHASERARMAGRSLRQESDRLRAAAREIQTGLGDLRDEVGVKLEGLNAFVARNRRR